MFSKFSTTSYRFPKSRTASLAVAVAVAAAVGTLAIAAPSPANTVVSLQFPNGAVTLHNNYSNNFAGQNLSAGVIPATYWNADSTGGNTVGYPTTISGPVAADTYPFGPTMLDSTGATTGISYTGTTDGNFNGGGSAFTSGTGDYYLFQTGSLVGYNSPTNVNSYTLTGLKNADSYNLVVYVATLFTQNYEATITSGSTSYYATVVNTLSSYVQSTSTNSASPAIANYVEFMGLTPTAGSLTFSASVTSGTGNGFLLPGIQLVDTGSVNIPEPATLGLMAVAGAGILLLKRRSSVKA